jgi:hypothetical protein
MANEADFSQRKGKSKDTWRVSLRELFEIFIVLLFD